MGDVQLSSRCSVCGALSTPAEPLYRSLETGRLYCGQPRYISGRRCLESDVGELAPWSRPSQLREGRPRGCLAAVLALFLGGER